MCYNNCYYMSVTSDLDLRLLLSRVVTLMIVKSTVLFFESRHTH